MSAEVAELADLEEIILPGLGIVVLRALGDPEEVPDAVQETVARAVAAIRRGTVPPDVPLSAFVLGIARHVIADVIRRRIRTRAAVASGRLPTPQPSPTPLDALVQEEEVARIERALCALAESDRVLLRRCIQDGDRPADIAREMGTSAETIRQRKCRALERLRALLSDAGHTSSIPPTSKR